MKKKMGKWMCFVTVALLLACGHSETKKQFKINGKIINGTAKMVYLEEVPAGNSQGTIVDSFNISKDGSFSLNAGAKEAVIYNIRLDKSDFPIVAVINDAPHITLNVTLRPGSNAFAETYDVQGSPASTKMKDYMFGFNNYLQQIYPLAMQADSMRKLQLHDSAYRSLAQAWKQIAGEIKKFTISSLAKANNPALYVFELGYYQGSADQRAFGLEPIDVEEELKMLNEAITRFPGHQGLIAVKNMRESEVARYNEMNQSKWVGKQAPDFTLPDPNGKEIRLSSFRGKYLLVDFWASWCVPCRAENPNVVKAYNQFRDKNFSILGVSLDHPGDKSKWLQAIRQDNLTWTQVSDLKGWESIVVPMYDFGQAGIPYNILIDPAGVIIAERLKGPALEAKLAEVLK